MISGGSLRGHVKIDKFALIIPSNVHIIPPVSYLEMMWLKENCAVIATDFGGVQKEAYFMGKPCVVLRDETEWVELIDAGWNPLVGANSRAITEATVTASTPDGNTKMFGDGTAADKIVSLLA
jgi:UDP-GlcNAc3NAcA epimerase